MNNIILTTFCHPCYGMVVGFKDQDGRDWFADLAVATMFQHTYPEKAIHDFIMEEDRGFGFNQIEGSNPGFVSLEGVSQLALHSTMPQAQEIKNWISRECAPTLRAQRIKLMMKTDRIEFEQLAQHFKITTAQLVGFLLEHGVIHRVGTKFYLNATLMRYGFVDGYNFSTDCRGVKRLSPYPSLTFRGARFIKELWRQDGSVSLALQYF